jgi:hypothetical protein
VTDDRDRTWLGAAAPPAPTHPEYLLWALVKGARRVECRSRELPHGAELRVGVDGELYWSRVFTSVELLEEAAEYHRRAFESLRWTTPGPRDVGR